MKEVLPCFVRLARRAGTRDFCPYLADLVGPVQIFLTAHYFTLKVHKHEIFLNFFLT